MNVLEGIVGLSYTANCWRDRLRWMAMLEFMLMLS